MDTSAPTSQAVPLTGRGAKRTAKPRNNVETAEQSQPAAAKRLKVNRGGPAIAATATTLDSSEQDDVIDDEVFLIANQLATEENNNRPAENEISLETLQKLSSQGTLNRANVIIPVFNENVGLDQFLLHFEMAAKHYGWSEDEKLVHMKTRIEGPAGRLVWSQKQSTVEELIQLLQNSYGNEALRERTKLELETRKRNDGETLQDLYADVRKLLSDAYPEYMGQPLRTWARSHS